MDRVHVEASQRFSQFILALSLDGVEGHPGKEYCGSWPHMYYDISIHMYLTLRGPSSAFPLQSNGSLWHLRSETGARGRQLSSSPFSCSKPPDWTCGTRYRGRMPILPPNNAHKKHTKKHTETRFSVGFSFNQPQKGHSQKDTPRSIPTARVRGPPWRQRLGQGRDLRGPFPSLGIPLGK